MRGLLCLPCPQMMTERSLDILRSLCYFPDFSYKANTFIFYAKVIQRIYIKVGEGWLSKELSVQLLPHGLPAGPFFFPKGGAVEQRVTPASTVPALPGVPSWQDLRPSFGSTASDWGGGRNGGSRSRRKLPVLKHFSLFIFSFFFGGKDPCKALSQAGKRPKCHHRSRDWSIYKY